MSTRKRPLEGTNDEKQVKRQKIEHNEVPVGHPFDLPELVEAIVSHLLRISPLSILNILCSSKKLSCIIRSKTLWLRRGFKQLHDLTPDNFVTGEYLRAVLSQIRLDQLRSDELNTYEQFQSLDPNRFDQFSEKGDLLETLFDLDHDKEIAYDTHKIDVVEYLADRSLTNEAYRVILNIMARTPVKLFTIHQLIQFIEISEDEIIKKRKQKHLHEHVSVDCDFGGVEELDFNEFVATKVDYYPNTKLGPEKFYPLLVVSNQNNFTTALYREGDYPSTWIIYTIRKRFIDEHRSILLLDGDASIAGVVQHSQTAYIKFNSKKNLIEECGFLTVRALKENEDEDKHMEYLRQLLEIPNNNNVFTNNWQHELIDRLFDGDKSDIVERAKPTRFFRNVRFRLTENDIYHETSLVKVYKDHSSIWFESILPYLVNYPKTFLNFAGACKSFRNLLFSEGLWKRLGFINFAEWYFHGDAVSGISVSEEIKFVLAKTRENFIHDTNVQRNAEVQRLKDFSVLSRKNIDRLDAVVLKVPEEEDEEQQFVSIHGVRFQEYLANTKLTEEAACIFMFIKRVIAADVISLEDLIRFVELDEAKHMPNKTMLHEVTDIDTLDGYKDKYLFTVNIGTQKRSERNFMTLLTVSNTYTSRQNIDIDEDVCQVIINIEKIYLSNNRSVLFIQSYCNLKEWSNEEHFYIKYDKRKNLIEEFGTLSTFRLIECPNEDNPHIVLKRLLENPNYTDEVILEMLTPRHIRWQDPMLSYHLKNIKLKKD